MYVRTDENKIQTNKTIRIDQSIWSYVVQQMIKRKRFFLKKIRK